MLKRMWILPLLSAAFWAACRDPMQMDKMSVAERDVRSAICGLVISLAMLVIVSTAREEKWGK